MTTFFQIDKALSALLEYGILGALLIFVGFFAYKMYIKINEDQKIWRNEAIASRKDLTNLMVRQNELNSTLINIRQKDVDQNKENFHDIKQHLERLPEQVAKEIKVNFTSSGT
jgi:hypothetical protein